MKVDKFYYPVDFVVLDTEHVAEGINKVPIILGRPFLATSNAIINCRNGVMQLTFGNMTLECRPQKVVFFNFIFLLYYFIIKNNNKKIKKKSGGHRVPHTPHSHVLSIKTWEVEVFFLEKEGGKETKVGEGKPKRSSGKRRRRRRKRKRRKKMGGEGNRKAEKPEREKFWAASEF